ncbi:MAG: penicillin-binding protein 1A [Burkholderiales bacterium]
MSVRWLTYPLLLVVVGVFATALLFAFVAVMIWPTLPSLEVLTDYRPKVPLRVYSADGKLIGEFGEERRAVVSMQQVPKPMVDAILAAEDERYYQHKGVDYIGLARAAIANFTLIGPRQGASTITMQVARNFFLSREKTLTRKFNEILLAFKIESSLNKSQILELYINQIYLGQRAYGFASAAHIYYGKKLDQLSLAETAMLAGLPKAPSSFNPVANPARAKLRQQYVLRRMREMGAITAAQQVDADKQPMAVKNELNEFATRAEYVAEMVRAAMYERYQEGAYALGLKVYTTILVDHQTAAYAALRKGVLEYDRRHGYRGPEAYAEVTVGATEETLEEALQEHGDSDDIVAAIVTEAAPKRVKAYRRGGGWIEITDAAGLKFVAEALTDKAGPNLRIRRGAIIRVQPDEKKRLFITQLPAVESTLVSADPKDGAIRALVGGFDFNRAQYNHATQALRQPGSSFKPFIYSAALEKGFTPSTIINDEPLQFTATQTGGQAWDPKNYDGKYDGPMPMRNALMRSKNLVSIRILQSIGTHYAQDYITKFGFDAKLHPPYLTMALGAGNVTPMQMVAGYSVFANGGYRIKPYFIQRIEDGRGTVLFEERPVRARESAQRAIDERNAYIMTSMMRDVVRGGTAASAMKLGRGDLGGKTGTTNDFLDAWFAGFNSGLVGVVWVGYDQPQTLGRNETGGGVALPIWINYMGVVLKGVPEQSLDTPKGLLTTGGEVYYQEYAPREESSGDTPASAQPGTSAIPDAARNQLF